MHIFHNVLQTFPEVLTRRIRLTNQQLLSLVKICFILMTLTCDSRGDIIGRNLVLVTLMVERAKLQIQGMENIADLQFLKKLMRVFLFAMSTLTIKIRELECGFNRNNQSRS